MQDVMIWEDTKQVEEIKEIYGKDLTATEFKTLIGIGKATNLNPFLREIWAVKYNGQAACIFIGRDGYRKAAQANPLYDYHMVDAVYANDEFKIENGLVHHSYGGRERGALLGAYCIVKRRNASQPIYLYVERNEYDIKKSVWLTKPATMIKKVAEAQALRMAFQDIFGGTYDESEQWDDKAASKPAVFVDVTANGNPRGTITEPQNAKIDALLNDLGATKEQADEYSTRNFGTRISGLSVEHAGKLIEALENRVKEKEAAAAPMPPAIAPEATAAAVEPTTDIGAVGGTEAPTEPVDAPAMTTEDVVAAFGGKVEDALPVSPAIEAMRAARDGYIGDAKTSGASL